MVTFHHFFIEKVRVFKSDRMFRKSKSSNEHKTLKNISITKRPLNTKQIKGVQNNRIKVWEFKIVECLEIYIVKVGACSSCFYLLVLRYNNCIHCINPF